MDLILFPRVVTFFPLLIFSMRMWLREQGAACPSHSTKPAAPVIHRPTSASQPCGGYWAFPSFLALVALLVKKSDLFLVVFLNTSYCPRCFLSVGLVVCLSSVVTPPSSRADPTLVGMSISGFSDFSCEPFLLTPLPLACPKFEPSLCSVKE